MILTSKPFALLLFIAMFGGIAASSALGWWQTESSKVPAVFTDGEFAGQANPADIRGSYTFGDISESFEVTPLILAQAFQANSDDPAAFAVKDLEALYLDSGYEIGTNSVRMFVAFYTGLPFDVTGQEIYLPTPAASLLLERGMLTSEEAIYIQSHIADVTSVPSTKVAPTSVPGEEASVKEATAPIESGTEEHVVKGKTTFGELIDWGVPQETIEQIIGAPMLDPALKVKDFATASGVSFETLRAELQLEVDKANP